MEFTAGHICSYFFLQGVKREIEAKGGDAHLFFTGEPFCDEDRLKSKHWERKLFQGLKSRQSLKTAHWQGLLQQGRADLRVAASVTATCSLVHFARMSGL